VEPIFNVGSTKLAYSIFVINAIVPSSLTKTVTTIHIVSNIVLVHLGDRFSEIVLGVVSIIRVGLPVRDAHVPRAPEFQVPGKMRVHMSF
jgi:hypothetical protein